MPAVQSNTALLFHLREFLAGNSFPIKIAIGALGIVVAVIASLLGLLQLQEHWIEYRATAESLRKEKFLFLTQTEPYDKDDAFHLLVQRVEALLSKENTEWAAIHDETA